MSDNTREAFDAWRSSGSWTRPDDPGEWAAWQAALAQQPAPAAVPDDLRHDAAYRNGLMAGFGFGVNGDENGYATALAGYNREIHEARALLAASPAAPVAVRQEPVACSICEGTGAIAWNDEARRAKNDGKWGRCLHCRPYTVPPAAEQPDTIPANREMLEHWANDLALNGVGDIDTAAQIDALLAGGDKP